MTKATASADTIFLEGPLKKVVDNLPRQRDVKKVSNRTLLVKLATLSRGRMYMTPIHILSSMLP